MTATADTGADLTESKSFFTAVEEQVVVPTIVPSKKALPLSELAAAPSSPEDMIVETSAHALHAAPSAAAAAHEVVVEEVVKPVIVAPKAVVVPDLIAIAQRAQAAGGVGRKVAEVADDSRLPAV